MPKQNTKCPICLKSIRNNCRAVECDQCLEWCHFKCSLLTVKEFNSLSASNVLWLCQLCRHEVFPFCSLEDQELLKPAYNSNVKCQCSRSIEQALLSNLPQFDTISTISNLPNLNDFDPDNNIPNNVNFKYYTPHDFHCAEFCNIPSNKSLSFLHCNVRSLNANFDKLHNLLSSLDYPFKIIGLSETWISTHKDLIINPSIPGFKVLSQPTKFNAGGVGFYIAENLNFEIRTDLSVSSDQEESLWIEIQNKNSKNIVCGVIYRHPNSSLPAFNDTFYKTIDKIHKEVKLVAIMGDFNINLLSHDSHNPTDEFINTLFSYSFQPHILQPSRITSHSATLIDNIFFNSLEYRTYSGNIFHDLSDHLPNFLIIDSIQSQPNKIMYTRDYSNLNKQALINEFQEIDWNQQFHDLNNVNDISNAFLNTINDIINTYVPLKKLSRKEIKFKTKPWITQALKTIY